MDRTERLYRIMQLLDNHRAVSRRKFLEALEVSPATFKRDLEILRDRFNAPIIWDSSLRGYRYAAAEPDAATFALPGLWFSAQEIHALLTMQQLLANLGSGLLTPHIQPLLTRLNAVLESQDYPGDEVRRRIRILHMAARSPRLDHFATVASATLKRRRLRINYLARSSNTETGREVSPQRLVHYRDNWYLDAWCHLRRGLRSFSIDAISSAVMLDKNARPVSEQTLQQVLASGYGIFSGAGVSWAKLRFTPERARWVAAEQWHPEQHGRFEDDGTWLLEIPFSDARELVMDILRHGAGVEVVSPAHLRARVHNELLAAASRYQP